MSLKTRVIGGAGAAILGIASLAAPIVMNYEGKENAAYLDPVSIPTICYGHTATAKMGQVMSDAECQRLLEQDLGTAIKQVNAVVTHPINDYTRAALGSFVYNVGIGNFASSTALKKFNRGDVIGGCDELKRWVYAGGKKLNGLVFRRDTESALCKVGVN